MKKLTTEDVIFLWREGSLNKELRESWGETRNSAWQDVNNHQRGRASGLGMLIGGVILFLVVFTFSSSNGTSDFTKSKEMFWAITLYGGVLCYVISLEWKESKFTNDLNSLRKMFDKNGRKETRLSARPFTNQDFSWLKEEAEWILSSLGNKVTTTELLWGVKADLTNTHRMEFKQCHNILAMFKLCQKDQSRWLPDVEKLPEDVRSPKPEEHPALA